MAASTNFADRRIGKRAIVGCQFVEVNFFDTFSLDAPILLEILDYPLIEAHPIARGPKPEIFPNGKQAIKREIKLFGHTIYSTSSLARHTSYCGFIGTKLLNEASIMLLAFLG